MSQPLQEIFLLRHGMTVWNYQRRLQGRRDSPLSIQGRSQAVQISQVLKTLNLKRLWTSPLGRARETAAIINRYTGLEPEVIPDYQEIAFGDWEGFTLPEIDIRWPGAWLRWREDSWNVRPPGGESYVDAHERAYQVMDRLERESAHSLAIVGHYAFNRLLIALMMQWGPAEAFQMNIPHDTVYRLERCNEAGIQSRWKISHRSIENHHWHEGIIRFTPAT